MLFTSLCLKATISDSSDIVAFNGAIIKVRGVSSYEMKLTAQAQIFNLECSMGDAFRLGAGLATDYYLPRYASFHAAYIGSYFNIQKLHANTLAKGENKLKGFSLFEVGGRLHISDRNGLARHKLILSQHTDYVIGGTVTTTRYLKAKFPCRRIFALRGGLYLSNAPVSTDMNKSELAVGTYGGVKTKDGTVLSNVYFTNAYTKGVYLGLCDLFNMSVRTSYGGSNYNSSLLRELYVDVILASTSFDPFSVGGVSYEVVPNTTGSFQTSNMGWRAGKKMMFTRRTVNLAFSLEVGSRPGVYKAGAYFGCGMSVAFVK